MRTVSAIVPRRIVPAGTLLGLLAGLGAAAAVFWAGPMGCLVPFGVALLLLLLAKPRVALALTVVAVINLGHAGKLGQADALLFPSIAKILGAVTLMAWLLHTLKDKKAVFFSKQMWAGAAFVACGVLSVMHAQDGYVAMANVSKLVANFALYFLIANLIETRQHLRQFVLLIILTGVVASGVAVLQYTLPQFQVSGDVFFQEFGRHEGGVVTPEQLEAGGFVRSTGTLEDPNWLALFLVAVLALNFYVLAVEERGLLRVFALMALALELAALVMTHNRTGFLGILLVLVLLLALRMLKITPPVVLLLSLFAVLAAVTLPRSYVERVLSWKHQKESVSIATRWDLQVNGLDIFLDHWLFGVGQGNFGAAFMHTNSEAASEVYWLTEVAQTNYREHEMGAHNMYLEVAIETGIIGLALLLLFLGLGLSDAQYAARRAAETNASVMADLARAVQISLIVFCVIALFLHAQEQKIWWILMGVSAAMAHIAADEREESPLTPEPESI